LTIEHVTVAVQRTEQNTGSKDTFLYCLFNDILICHRNVFYINKYW